MHNAKYYQVLSLCTYGTNQLSYSVADTMLSLIQNYFYVT
jgi:hypothetical protein